MLLLHWLSRWQHSFSCAPRMDFSIEQTSFDDWIVWSELGSLLCSHPENGDAPQLALIARHSFNESVMLLHHIHELRRVWVPSLLLSKPRGRDARRVEWNFAEIHGILPNSGSSIAIIRRACDESSYRLHECSGSAPRDVSARALYPQLRPGGIAGPPGEHARRAYQWVRVLPGHAFERRPRPRRDRAGTLRAGRVGGGALLLRA